MPINIPIISPMTALGITLFVYFTFESVKYTKIQHNVISAKMPYFSLYKMHFIKITANIENKIKHKNTQ